MESLMQPWKSGEPGNKQNLHTVCQKVNGSICLAVFKIDQGSLCSKALKTNTIELTSLYYLKLAFKGPSK